MWGGGLYVDVAGFLTVVIVGFAVVAVAVADIDFAVAIVIVVIVVLVIIVIVAVWWYCGGWRQLNRAYCHVYHV